jgi:hypothetical protein
MFSLFLGNSSSNYFDYTTSRYLRGELMFSQTAFIKQLAALFVITIVFATGGCAALQPVDATGPRANAPAYPITFPDSAARLEQASVAWSQLSQRYGGVAQNEARLNPYTGTVMSLPPGSGPVLLPKVGTDAVPTEEQTRESLRRFIADWRQLIGADADELSLVERTDEKNGIRVARYEQKPFRYPLRGGYGNLVIQFSPDREVKDILSTCIPNADRLQAALNALTPKINADQAVDHVRSKPFVATNVNGVGQQTFTLPANATAAAHELVVYALPASEQNSGLQLRLAWEVQVTNGPVKTVYLDAISDQVIAVA